MVKRRSQPGTITNSRVRHDYKLSDELVVGIELTGREVKSLRQGQGHLRGAYVTIKDGELWLINATVTGAGGYKVPENEWTRPRKLLAKRREIDRLIKAKQQGLAILPVSVITGGRFIKLRISLGASKKRFDKRETIKARDVSRQISRVVKRG